MTLILESRMPGNWPVRFGGGESEKYQQWQLAGSLSYWNRPVWLGDKKVLYPYPQKGDDFSRVLSFQELFIPSR